MANNNNNTNNRECSELKKACPTLAHTQEYASVLECNESALPERASGNCVVIRAADPKRSPLAMSILGLWVAASVVLIAAASLSDCVVVPALARRRQREHAP